MYTTIDMETIKRNKVYFFFQAEDAIRALVRSRGLGDVYKRQGMEGWGASGIPPCCPLPFTSLGPSPMIAAPQHWPVVVAGGGPAGFMAAISAAEAGARGVLVLESTPEPLGKGLISGGGRGNVTHACWDPRALVGDAEHARRPLRLLP